LAAKATAWRICSCDASASIIYAQRVRVSREAGISWWPANYRYTTFLNALNGAPFGIGYAPPPTADAAAYAVPLAVLPLASY